MLFGSSTRTLRFNDKGLIPAVVQDYHDKKVLMYVQMTREAVRRTRKTKDLWLYHRQKKKTWKKGSRTGKTMKVVDMLLHHDRNILVVQVVSKGVACHTGQETCFYHSYLNEPDVNPPEMSSDETEGGMTELKKLFEKDDFAHQVEIIENPTYDAGEKDETAHVEETRQEPKQEAALLDADGSDPMKALFEKIRDDLIKESRDSDSSPLAAASPEQIAQRIAEEAVQLVVSTAQRNQEQIVLKGAAIIRHLLVLLAERKIDVESFKAELSESY